MLRWYNLLTCLVLALVLVEMSRCGNDNKATPQDPQSRTIVDMTGRHVRIPKNLSRVALFGGPSGQIAFILGVQDRLCAVTNTLRLSALAVEMYPAITKVPGPRTTSGSINIEETIASTPQLVIAGDVDGDLIGKKTSIPVAYLESSMDQGYETIVKEIRFYGDVFGAQQRAECYVTYLEKTREFLKSRIEKIPAGKRKIVFNGYSTNHLVTLGGDTFLNRHIETAGCINAAKGISTTGKREGMHVGLGEISMEQVLAWNPDILIIDTGTPEDLYKDPRWKNITAVRNRCVYFQPSGIFIWNRPTAESAVLYPLWLAVTAYPDVFSDISLHEEIRKFYKEVFHYTLSDEQVKNILSGEYARTMARPPKK